MRYKNLEVDSLDSNYLLVEEDNCQGNILLCATDELVDITNMIREEQGNTDLVTEYSDNDVYYNFYLNYNTKAKEILIEATCNNGEKDDFVDYILPMTEEEKVDVMFQVIEMLTEKVFKE